HQVLHAVAAHVRDVDADLRLVAVEVEEVASVVREQAVHREHGRAQVGEATAEVATDEAQPARDQDLAPAVEVPGVDHERPSTRGAVSPATAAGFKCSSRTTSSSQSRPRSQRVRKTRGKLKNWLLP